MKIIPIRILAIMASSMCFPQIAASQCFDYRTLAVQRDFAESLSAAACVGYAAAFIEQADPLGFDNLRVAATVSDVLEELDCPSRQPLLGNDGDADAKFQFGYDLAYVNVNNVDLGIMRMDEVRERVATCTTVTGYYVNLFDQTMN